MSTLLFFLMIITKIAKLMGIASATIFPNKEPVEIESPTITIIPLIARNIEIEPINETFSLKKKNTKIARNIVCVLMIKTTFATVVLLIATTKATKLNDKTNPPNNPGRPESLITIKVFFFIS